MNVKMADPVHKATIVPRGQALGMVMQLPEGDRYSMKYQQMVDRIAIMAHGKVRCAGAPTFLKRAYSVGYSVTISLAAADGANGRRAFGKPFISNPDLGARIRADAPWQPLVQATLYGGGAAGYTDYPTLGTATA
jgi:2,4-dienoyl-CoA reductase-like NADH-dependent reductase (Old Yellow Enzyme family)